MSTSGCRRTTWAIGSSGEIRTPVTRRSGMVLAMAASVGVTVRE